MLRVPGHFEGNSPVTAQMVSNAENVSIWWRLHNLSPMLNDALFQWLQKSSNDMLYTLGQLTIHYFYNLWFMDIKRLYTQMHIWIGSWRCGFRVTWFCSPLLSMSINVRTQVRRDILMKWLDARLWHDMPYIKHHMVVSFLRFAVLTLRWCHNQRKHQISTSLAFVRGIHRSPVNSPHKWPVTCKMFPLNDAIMNTVIFSEFVWSIRPYSPELLHYHKGNRIIAPRSVK